MPLLKDKERVIDEIRHRRQIRPVGGCLMNDPTNMGPKEAFLDAVGVARLIDETMVIAMLRNPV